MESRIGEPGSRAANQVSEEATQPQETSVVASQPTRVAAVGGPVPWPSGWVSGGAATCPAGGGPRPGGQTQGGAGAAPASPAHSLPA